MKQATLTQKKDFLRTLIVLTKVLLGVSITCLFFIVYNVFLYKDSRLVDVSLPGTKQGQKSSPDGLALPELKPFNLYADFITQRDIFKLPYTEAAPSVEQAGIPVQNEVNVTVTDWVSNYRVVGILLDKEPQAIIEDLENKETLFVSQGEEIKEAVLEKIERGRVIFLYHNQHIELNL